MGHLCCRVGPMASIENRGDLQWRAVVRKKGFPRYSRTFDRHRDALGWATDLEAAIGRRQLAEVRRLTSQGDEELSTVADLVDAFITKVVEMPGRRANQVATERPRLRRIRDDLGKLTIEMLSTQDVLAWRDKRLKEGSAPQTVRHDLNQLSVLLETAKLAWKVEKDNVVREVPKPSVKDAARTRRVPKAEIEALLWASEFIPARGGRPAGRGMRPIIVLAVETGMRLGEMIALEWRHINLAKREAFLPETKTEIRTVILSTVAIEALKPMQSKLREDGRVFDWARSDSFVGRFSNLVQRARRHYEAECNARGEKPDQKFLTDLHFHDLRHEAASRLLEEGLTIVEVMEQVGHTSMQTAKRYLHGQPSSRLAKIK